MTRSWRAVPQADRPRWRSSTFDLQCILRVYGPALELLNANRLLGTGISSGWRAGSRNYGLDGSRT
jgi:hypothetical protein